MCHFRNYLLSPVRSRSLDDDQRESRVSHLEIREETTSEMPTTLPALVVQSIYNARRAPAFQITAQYYWRRTCERRSFLDAADRPSSSSNGVTL